MNKELISPSEWDSGLVDKIIGEYMELGLLNPFLYIQPPLSKYKKQIAKK